MERKHGEQQKLQTNPVIHQQVPQAYLENMVAEPYKQPGPMGPYKSASSTTTDQEKEIDLDRAYH